MATKMKSNQPQAIAGDSDNPDFKIIVPVTEIESSRDRTITFHNVEVTEISNGETITIHNVVVRDEKEPSKEIEGSDAVKV
jgi:hypothetical protein